VKPSDEFNRRRNGRALITAIALVALVVLIYAITLSKMHHGG
jgi:type II secretory pathway component PulK